MARRIAEQRRRGPIDQLIRLASWGIHVYFAFILYLVFSGEVHEVMSEFAENEASSVATVVIMVV